MTPLKFWWHYPFIWLGLGPWLSQEILNHRTAREMVNHLYALCAISASEDVVAVLVQKWALDPLVISRFGDVDLAEVQYIVKHEIWPYCQAERANP